jgi:hypothetical protein
MLYHFTQTIKCKITHYVKQVLLNVGRPAPQQLIYPSLIAMEVALPSIT